tara:strand:- start:136 stop:651 length:516 start_codon:yes stop_codon:yes gene_type:complete
MNENELVKNKIIKLLNTPPKSIGVIDNPDLSYNDIYNLWSYFRLNNDEYIQKYGKINSNWNTELNTFYKNLYNQFEIFDNIFNNHVNSDIDDLLVFYNINENFFYCKFKTVNNINKDILEEFKENMENLKIDPTISMFWNIELKVPELQNDFQDIYKSANIDKNNTLLITF